MTKFRRLICVLILAAAVTGIARAEDRNLERIVGQGVAPLLSDSGAGGVAVALRIDGRTRFFNYGFADLAGKRAVTPGSLFNLASVGKVFDVALLAQAADRGEIGLNDPVAKYVVDLQAGGDIRRVTLRQLASHTSGLSFPQDHPPWPKDDYTLAKFIHVLRAWTADEAHAPGEQFIYSHAGYLLLHLALERRFGSPFGDLVERRVLKPLGMASTFQPLRGPDSRPQIAPDFRARAVQGYSEDGEAIGEPGDVQSYYHWAGTEQFYSSARDMAAFLAACLGERPFPSIVQAIGLTTRPVLPIGPSVMQALAWEVHADDPEIIDKNGGLNNTSTYIGLVPKKALGIVILANRGNQNNAAAGRDILRELAR